MSAQSWRVSRAFACTALCLSLFAGPVFLGPAAAQQAAVAGPLGAHDAAIEATRKGDYVAARELAMQAAAAGHPLDAEQVDFISAKADKQQAQRDADAKLKATQVAAAAAAQQIMDRQQKDYAERSARVEAAKHATAECGQQGNISNTLVSDFASAEGQGVGTLAMNAAGGPASGATAVPGTNSRIGGKRCGG